MATSASAPLASSVEKTNGAKLSRLLIDGGTTVLRNIFDHYHHPANLLTDLNSHRKTLRSLLRGRILKKPQWDLLFPPPGVAPDSRSFDITLLFLLLTNICGLSCPSSGWHSKPHASYNSFEANLARIKFYRNELYGHVTTTSVDESTFNNLWQEISSVLVALGLDKAEIDRLKDEHCGEEDYIDALLDWVSSEEDIKSHLRDIRRNQTENREIFSKVLQTQHDCGKVLEENKSKLEELEESQATTWEVVQEQHETLKTDFQEVKCEIEQLKKKQERERSDKILKNLMQAEFKGDIEHHVKRFQEGTREWIFKKVEDWLNDRNSPNRVMVISGNAGMGKSVISAIICERIQEAGRLSGSHFCQHNNARYSKPQLMLQSLAIHLSRTLPEYKRALVLSVTTGVDGLIEALVTDLKLVYAKLCVNSNCPSEDLHNVQKHVRPALPQEVCSNLDLLQDVLRKHSFLLRDHPLLFFQSLVNEGLPELSSIAASILDNDLSHVSYLKYVHTGEGNGAVKARFYGSHRVACFDVSPDMNFMVCECRDGTVHLWSLKTGNIQWKRPSFITRQYVGIHPYGWNSDFGAYRQIDSYILTFYNSVIFHPNGKYVLPGNLRNVYTLNGDCVELFIDSKCKFAHCVFPKDKKAMLTDRFDNPKQLSLWSMEDGTEVHRFKCEETISAFTISEDGSTIAFADLTGSIYLQVIDRWNTPALLMCIGKACGLMHLSPDGEFLCCGHLPCEIDSAGMIILGWIFGHNRTFTFCDLRNLDDFCSSGEIFLWPIQSGNSVPDYFPNWVENIRSVFPCFSAGFFRKLDSTTVLTGGPSFNYIVAVNVDVLSATNSTSAKMKVREVVMSVEGDAIYSISSSDDDYRDREVLVTVVRMSSKEILTKKLSPVDVCLFYPPSQVLFFLLAKKLQNFGVLISWNVLSLLPNCVV